VKRQSTEKIGGEKCGLRGKKKRIVAQNREGCTIQERRDFHFELRERYGAGKGKARTNNGRAVKEGSWYRNRKFLYRDWQLGKRSSALHIAPLQYLENEIKTRREGN